MANVTTDYGYYTSKAGVEIQAVFNNTKFGDLHMIKYATQRDVANVHVMGRVDAVSVAKGKRATTGACVFAVFEKDRLVEAMSDSKVFLTEHELVNYGGGTAIKQASNAQREAARKSGTIRSGALGLTVTGSSVFSPSSFGEMVAPQLLDQVPPFDITLVGISEASGNVSRMIIHGVQFSSDQGGSSVDDLLLERQVTFLARRISPWIDVSELSQGSGASNAPVNLPSAVGTGG